MSKHTPGPWAVGPAFDNDGQPEIIIEHQTPAGNLVVAVALGGLQGQEENARLIAAAPDMLAALNFLNQCSAPMTGQQEECWKLVRAAIAKATGELFNSNLSNPRKV